MKIKTSHFKWLKTSSRKFTTNFGADREAFIYLSSCHDIYKNLAFEDWIYEKVDLSKKRILFIWRNSPSVVIGRHQNPWQECNLLTLRENDINLARRKSGGGTVYHDLGNINLTFFTHRPLYNRQENLALVIKVLKERWQLNVKASPRDDILLEDKYKISGTSSKLGRVTAYHHCTLLLNVDTNVLHDVLQPTYKGMSTNATVSIRSEVKNLSSIAPSLTYNDVAMAIAQEYNHVYAPGQPMHLQVINPSDNHLYPGIDKFSNELKSWQWLYGKTPKFELSLSVKLSHGNTRITFSCYHGIIKDIHTQTQCRQFETISNSISYSLKGLRFHPRDIINTLEEVNTNTALSIEEIQFVTDIIQWLQYVTL